jgi:ABC-2 type transport system ATP-binding protein
MTAGASTGTTPVLTCKGLAKRYGERQAVDDVGFTIDEGEAYGLLGPNGAGKTTTIAMLCGLLERDAGEVVVAGRPLGGRDPGVKRAIGYVPQEIALYPELTGAENLAFFGRLYGLAGAGLRRRVAAGLDVAGLTDRGGDRVKEYSGGMRRRLNIAAGLLHEPRLLVLDEPTVGVDPQSRNAILDSVAALSAAGTAVLYTSHYMEEVERLCDRVGIIDEGRLIAEGTRRELVADVGQADRVDLATDGDAAALAAACRTVAGVSDAQVVPGGVQLLATHGRNLLPALVGAAGQAGAPLSSIEVTEPDLESVFLHLTGKALRD